MDVSQVKRLKELKDENRRLKKMYSDLALNTIRSGRLSKKNYRVQDEKGSDRENSGRASYQIQAICNC